MIKGSGQVASETHILLLALFAFVVGFSGLLTVPPLDRDESRFVQATTQMLETGDFVQIRYQEQERNKKPIGIYWVQAASVSLLADVDDRPLWAFRTPSILAVVGAVAITYMIGTLLFGQTTGLMAGMLLAAAPVVAAEASMAKTDAVLLFCVVGMQFALLRMLSAPDPSATRTASIWFYLALGAGILTKGPIAPLVAVGTIGGLMIWGRMTKTNVNWRQRLRPLLGLGILIGMILPWGVSIILATDGRFLVEALGTDMLGKVVSGQESHGAPPGFHIAALSLVFWPAALFLPAAIAHFIPAWREARVAFLFAWIAPVWIVFELTATKLPHYTLVLLPALAVLVGALVARGRAQEHRRWRWFGAGLFGLVGIIASGLGIYLAMNYSLEGVDGWHLVGAAMILTATAVTITLALRYDQRSAASMAALTSAIFAWVTFEGVLPTLEQLVVTPRLAAMLDRNEAHPLRDNVDPVALVGYHEPSAVFTFGTDTKLVGPREAAAWLASGEYRAAVVDRPHVTAFLSALPPGVAVEEVEALEGFNYSNSSDVQLILYRRRQGP